ncbi:thiolase [Lophiostoma macrostomum CBS 122681]|uniref:Thiolase n=1 Tax=Lophiostoma macrostomum CBS 122681 TaxID=1314788 RepID=A0A6A6TVT0_9PLEO|nr:thiolase [Lophiostoma macrostomum CBS 122681]
MPSLETPVIIGVGDIKNRSTKVEDAREPAQLMFEAIQAALSDASSSNIEELQASIDSIDVVKTWTWPYPDLPSLLAQKLGVESMTKHRYYSEHGGDKPGKLLDAAAKRIARGEIKVAVIAGGEALASLSACAAAKKLPPPGWTEPSEAVDSVFTPTGRDLGNNLGALHDIGAPIHVYPLYENAFRAHRGQSLQANHEESTKLYAEFAAVAEKQKYAWNYGKKDDEKTIGTVSKKNRMICFPYPLLMNAFNTINLSSALLLTSTTHARSLHIPPSHWIHPLSGAGTSDPPSFWHRPNFHTSPSISASLDTALSLANLSPHDIDLYDIYSCFPIVPKLAAAHLGLPILSSGEEYEKRPGLTVLGGLTSFGGAGNNYSMHALTEMTRALREGRGRTGLVLCNGGVLSYQYVIVLSKEGRKEGEGGYPLENDLPEVLDVKAPEIAETPEGEAVIETYTVEFHRDGSPVRGHIVGRLKSDGRRFLANHGDESTLQHMASGAGEMVGRSGWVRQDTKRKGRNLFSFEKTAKI